MKTINKFFFYTLAVFAFSCDDILEEDITDDMVQIISPINNAEIESNVVNFRWNNIDGADKYRIQVYASNQSMILDTLVNPSGFTYPMRGGDFQWRIRAENSAYKSSYSFPANFTIIETDDLSNQQMILSSPREGFYFNNTNVTLSWQVLRAAEKYELDLTNLTTGAVFPKSNLTTNSVIFSATELTQDAKYTWKVKAVNDSSETLYATRSFFIDRVNPNQPQNSLPANNSRQSANLQLDFTWNMPADNGAVQSPISYIIEFSNTADFNAITQTSNTLNPNFQQIFTVFGDYFWRIRAIDEAGNISTNSSVFKFTIN